MAKGGTKGRGNSPPTSTLMNENYHKKQMHSKKSKHKLVVIVKYMQDTPSARLIIKETCHT